MKYFAFFVLFTLSINFSAVAQRGNRAGDGSRLESARIGLITNRLNLSTEQAPQFWATYNEFTGKRKAIRRDIRQTRKPSAEPINDKIAQQSINRMLELRQQEVDLEKEYVAKFLRSISPTQLIELYQTEQEFNGMLIERLQERSPRQASPQPPAKEGE